jgi:hypothetical protein
MKGYDIMTFVQLLEFCKGASYINSHSTYHDFCGNNSEEWTVIKNSKTYTFSRNWGPSFDKLNPPHEVQYTTINPTTFNTEYHDYITGDGDAQTYFNF